MSPLLEHCSLARSERYASGVGTINDASVRPPGLASARSGWSGRVLSVVNSLHGCPSPVKAADASWRITLRVSLDRRRSPRRSGHYEEMLSE
jgi:hypothetical protein